jgi:hypothetical protein
MSHHEFCRLREPFRKGSPSAILTNSAAFPGGRWE